MMNNLSWKINRLRTMDIAEIGHRLKQAMHIKAQVLGIGLASNPPQACIDRVGASWLDPMPGEFDGVRYCLAADRICAGTLDIFSLRDAQLGFPQQWNVDPLSGIAAPTVLGRTINYRDEAVVGNIKYLWEPNRHLHLTTLAQAYHLSGDVRYAHAAQELLESWFDQCPYPVGPNWSSALELGIRLMNWAVSWHLLGGANSILFASEQGQQFRTRWLASIYQHCHFIAGHFSRCSSANNHLLGELTGLYVAASTWPCWQESNAWLELARTEMEAEVLVQNTEDGVNREQAIYYQHEVADMMLICLVVGRANGAVFSDAFSRRLESMLDFIACIMDVSGNVPMIGDADDALLIRWSQEPGWHPYRSLLATGAVLFNRADFKAKAGHFDDKSRWLLGDAASYAYQAISVVSERTTMRRTFPEGGYFIIGDRFNTAEEIRMVVDAGSLGYLSIAAHGHADALAFTLSVGGNEILIDPGTYAYHSKKKWRDYFRGTSAHNTVRVDGQDQSESGGNFMWLRKANSRCELWESNHQRDYFIGSHDGYLRLPDPVRHTRKIRFLKSERLVLVEDMLACKRAHEIEFNWHFSDACTLQIAGRKARVRSGKTEIEVSMPVCDSHPVIARGDENPPLGWISRRFDEKSPSPSLVWTEKIHGAIRRVTSFQIV